MKLFYFNPYNCEYRKYKYLLFEFFLMNSRQSPKILNETLVGGSGVALINRVAKMISPDGYVRP